jgi:hypothetical protein
MVQFSLSEAYRFKGMKNEAALHEEQAFLAEGDKKSAEAVKRAFERGGVRGMGEWLLGQDLEQARKKYVRLILWRMTMPALNAKNEDTLRALEDSYRERSSWLPLVQKEPVFDFLHSEPRYRDIVKKMGLPPAF